MLQKQADVGDHADGLARSTVADFGRDGGIDIDADDLHPTGHMLPIAIECSMEPRHSTTPAPFKCCAQRSCATFISVMVSGSGPSSRRLPASTNGTLFFTHSYITPAGQTSSFHRAFDISAVIDRVDGAHVIAVSVFFLPSIRQPHAERSAQQCRLNVVHAKRVSAQQSLDIAAADQLRQGGDPPVWTTTGPATTMIFCPGIACAWIAQRSAGRQSPPGARKKYRCS